LKTIWEGGVGSVRNFGLGPNNDLRERNWGGETHCRYGEGDAFWGMERRNTLEEKKSKKSRGDPPETIRVVTHAEKTVKQHSSKGTDIGNQTTKEDHILDRKRGEQGGLDEEAKNKKSPRSQTESCTWKPPGKKG